MELKVRAVDATEEKSGQQIEQELLDKHEEKLTGETPVENEATKVVTEDIKTPEESDPKEVQEENNSKELNEKNVLEFIGSRYGREINSLDELNQAREENEPLPEDVTKYLQFKKEKHFIN